MKSSDCKTGHKAKRVRCIGADAPSIKKDDAIYVLPNMEIALYKDERELKAVFKTLYGKVMKDTLWGFLEVPSTLGQPVRIHLRSVRSHRGKDQFYHTLGHEISHILEKMERIKPADTYVEGRYRAIRDTSKTLLLQVWYVVDLIAYGYKEKTKEEIKKRATCLYKRMERKAPKVCEKLQQSVLSMHRKIKLLYGKSR